MVKDDLKKYLGLFYSIFSAINVISIKSGFFNPRGVSFVCG